ncbi:MAG: RNA polymerase sigma factor SigZ [Bacteroidota bacterium]
MTNQDTTQIWDSYAKKLSVYIFKIVNDREKANDISQEVFLKLYQNRHHLENPETVPAWLFKTAHNLAIDHFREQKKTKQFPEIVHKLGPEPQTFRNKDLAACINPFIEKLPEKYREAMILTEVEGLSQKALAKKLNISYSGAKSRVQRGRQLLKNLIIECCIVEHDSYGNIIAYRPRCSCK